MLFNSPEFLVFLAVVYGLYRVLAFRAQNLMLLAASYLFYGWWDWRFLFLMTLSTTIDYWVGLTMERGRLTPHQKVAPAIFLSLCGLFFVGLNFGELGRTLIGQSTAMPLVGPFMPYVLAGIPAFLLVAALAYRYLSSLPEERRLKAGVKLSLVVQLGILGTFKYFNFFVDSFAELVSSVGLHANPAHLNIILPVGISFYTFQSLSYAIDIYRREIRATDRFLDFALFVSFFPQLVAGPIERARNLIPQLSNPRVITLEDTTRGLYLIVFGLFKKVAIADGVAPFVDQTFGSTGTLSWADVVLGTVMFAVQIYCDFSGYSDIARGVAKLFGVELMVNFNLPYFAKNPRDFWRRWHISLSTWLSDYLYRSLGGNRGSLAFTSRNLMLTMLFGGLWHGAAWNFVLWGFYHGSVLTVHRVWTATRGGAAAVRPLLHPVEVAKIGGFLLITLYGWLLFRATSLQQVVEFTGILFTGPISFDVAASPPRLSALIGMVLLAGIEIAQYLRGGNARFYQLLPAPALGQLTAAMLFVTVMGTSNEPAQFIYFQF